MKKILLLSLISIPLYAQTVVSENCKQLIEQAETTDDLDIYDDCGFLQGPTALSTWNEYALDKKLKKALYQLCIRYPSYPAGIKACHKSAELGYPAAKAVLGHFALKNDNLLEALGLYKEALSSDTLSTYEKARIEEELGAYYLRTATADFNAVQGLELLKKTAEQRMPLSNSILAALSMLGKYNLPVDEQYQTTHAWRAILLNCPMAEEIWGISKLYKQGKIKKEFAEYEINRRLYSCTEPEPDYAKTWKKCDCDTVLLEERIADKKPFKLISSTGKEAVLEDKKNKRITVKQGDILPNWSVLTVTDLSVTLQSQKKQVTIYMNQEKPCLSICMNIQQTGISIPKEVVAIKPYRLTFSQLECESIIYYANTLLDPELPFVGKEQCKAQINLHKTINDNFTLNDD